MSDGLRSVIYIVLHTQRDGQRQIFLCFKVGYGARYFGHYIYGCVQAPGKQNADKTSGFRSGAFEDSIIVGCRSASLGDWCPGLRDSLVVSPSTVEPSSYTSHSTLEKEPPGCLETLGINHLVTRRHVPVERTSHYNLRKLSKSIVLYEQSLTVPILRAHITLHKVKGRDGP